MTTPKPASVSGIAFTLSLVLASSQDYISSKHPFVAIGSDRDPADEEELSRLDGISAAVSPHMQTSMMVQKDMESLSEAEARLRLATEGLASSVKRQRQVVAGLSDSYNLFPWDQRQSSKKLDMIQEREEKALDGLAHPANVGFAPALELVGEELCNPTCRVGNGVCARQSTSPSSGFSCVCRKPFIGPSCDQREFSAESLTLYQTVTKTAERMRNPVVAFLLEPLLYGYSLFSCTFFVALAGVFSAAFMYMTKLGQEAGQATNLVNKRLLLAMPQPTEGALGRLRSYFKSSGSRFIDQRSGTSLEAAVESETDAEVFASSHRTHRKQEIWRPVPPHRSSRDSKSEAWQGYVDDESDCDVEACSRPPSGRYFPVGPVDER